MGPGHVVGSLLVSSLPEQETLEGKSKALVLACVPMSGLLIMRDAPRKQQLIFLLEICSSY